MIRTDQVQQVRQHHPKAAVDRNIRTRVKLAIHALTSSPRLTGTLSECPIADAIYSDESAKDTRCTFQSLHYGNADQRLSIRMETKNKKARQHALWTRRTFNNPRMCSQQEFHLRQYCSGLLPNSLCISPERVDLEA